MGKIPITPKAKKYAEENHILLDGISGSGAYGSIRMCDLLDIGADRKITSVAKKMAEYYHIDLADVKTNNQTIKKEDILRYTNLAEIMPLTPRRKTIANNILQSVNNSAQFTLFAQIDTTILMEFYRQKKADLMQSFSKNLSFTDIMIAVLAKTLLKVKKLNASLRGDRLHVYNYVNIALAVASGEGVVAPVIKGANMMELSEIIDSRTDFIYRTKANALLPGELDGGTFTLSNLGNSFVTYFTPIINYPQSAILGVGKTDKKLTLSDGELIEKDVTYFSLTLDHLILDGKDGDDFFVALDEIINHPSEYIR